MIISHKHKFIFIKLRKTAGTSLEIALSRVCGEEDIITPISKDDEKVRSELGYPGPQNFFIPEKYYSISDWKKRLLKGERKVFFNHMPAHEIKRYTPEKIWNSYFKFCFERNPWDKIISHYYHRGRTQEFENVMDYLLNNRGDEIQGFNMYSIKGKVVTDKVFRYEEMESALDELSNKIGTRITMPDYRAKSQFRETSSHYQDILTEEEAAFIKNHFSREIALMDYSF